MILTQLQVLLLVNNENAHELDKHAKESIERLWQCRMSKTLARVPQRLIGQLAHHRNLNAEVFPVEPPSTKSQPQPSPNNSTAPLTTIDRQLKQV